MKSLIAPIVATASFATIALSCLGAASLMTEPYRQHEFQNLKSGIWTAGPVRIDAASQTFERLAAVAPPAATAPEANRSSRSSDLSPETAVLPASEASTETAAANVAGNAVCQRKYRSYRPADNTYQPLSGGPRRQCELPGGGDALQQAEMTTPAEATAINSSTEHVSWCKTRYSSYNTADDTYQPFGAAERRTCLSPTTVASNG